jgi:hypothetical protein
LLASTNALMSMRRVSMNFDMSAPATLKCSSIALRSPQGLEPSVLLSVYKFFAIAASRWRGLGRGEQGGR